MVGGRLYAQPSHPPNTVLDRGLGTLQGSTGLTSHPTIASINGNLRVMGNLNIGRSPGLLAVGARVPGTHAIDEIVRASRKVVRFHGMLRCGALSGRDQPAMPAFMCFA
ncbi:hypothetical protein I41_24480 [Lacipirellula limnantheis]|uniref:Uncharacterized protein n=1 Tax=Lacipirellula limnantheis TaxID=2528024 RepID=A0A517TY21_9BACT|nr:hypothetical protein I41_24480 [Lacipirellula limnantheis]